MNYRVERQAAYVLHTRPYRDTSALVDLLTLEHGRVSVVSRGLRRPGSKIRGILQPFVPLQVSWQGRNDLKTLTLAESAGYNGLLKGKPLICALYANELLHKLLAVFDPQPKLFVYYQYLINSLIDADIEIPLRIFERQLIAELGYCVDLTQIQASVIYCYQLEQKLLTPVTVIQEQHKSRYFHGHHLLAIANDDYVDEAVKRSAKRFMRLQIDSLLEGRVLNSRDLLLSKKQK
ncbi:MAG: DNA repair protein RecO [Pseudomonadales bacterium]|nr:DNA repair protein RecO [Pseudomonadales bacterium]NRA16299.1 DNA repair protein RecO [Oceanospirillaceae bacterium]